MPASTSARAQDAIKRLKTKHQRSIEWVDAGPYRLHRLITTFLELNDNEPVSFRQTSTGFDIVRGIVSGWSHCRGLVPEVTVANIICNRIDELSDNAKIKMMIADGGLHFDETDRELRGWRAISKPIHGKPGEYGLHIVPAWV